MLSTRLLSFKAKMRVPFFTPLVFLSSTTVTCRLQGHARKGKIAANRQAHAAIDHKLAGNRAAISLHTRKIKDGACAVDCQLQGRCPQPRDAQINPIGGQ